MERKNLQSLKTLGGDGEPYLLAVQRGLLLCVRYEIPDPLSVVNNILSSQTAALGGHIRACKACGKTEIAYNPCKDRQCPKCGAFEKAQWLEEQKRWKLPTHYYHLIFTIDHVFNRLVWDNQKVMYDLLMRTSARVIQEFGEKYYGGEMGITITLHTWGQVMQRHAHTHAMVTGGALVKESGQYRWKAAGQTSLFPAKEFSAAFRQAFCEGVRRLWQQGKLRLGGERAFHLGFPGAYPFTRGIDTLMYRQNFWIMGQHSGFGSAEEAN